MAASQGVSLRRTLGFWALVAYGVGDILGAGIYALVGEIAGVAGHASSLAFLVALGVASITALSYAELGGRFPKSGGEAYFCQRAFGFAWLSLLVGWMVFCSGVVSLATVSLALAGYLLAPWAAPPGWAAPLAVVGFLVILAAINYSGMRQSSMTNIVCTIVEASGLLLVIILGVVFLMSAGGSSVASEAITPVKGPPWVAAARGAALAFFAFIGFEDMVNVAEEVKSPAKSLPWGILTALLIAGTVYLGVVWVATHVIAPHELAASQAPLLSVVQRAAPAFPVGLFTVFALFAVANTGLLNFIMGSRLVYGMAREGLLPSWLGHVHHKTQTPHWAILVVLVAAMLLALSGTLTYLAGTTSVLILTVFVVVNLSLVVIKRRGDSTHGFRVYPAVPLLGAVTSGILISFLPSRSLRLACVLILIGLGLVVWHDRRQRKAQA